MLLTDQHRSLLPLRFGSFQLRRKAEPDTLARRVLETLFSAKRIQCPVPLLRPAQNMNCRWNRNFLCTKSSLYSSKGCVPLSSPRPTSQKHVCRRHFWRCVGRNYAVYAIFGGGAAFDRTHVGNTSSWRQSCGSSGAQPLPLIRIY